MDREREKKAKKKEKGAICFCYLKKHVGSGHCIDKNKTGIPTYAI